MIDERQILQEGFARFVAAAQELEQSYAALKARAEAVDVQLQQTNRALERSLAEREAMFAALPIGLVAMRADGTVASANVEAQRLVAAATEHDVDLVRRRAGEVAFGEHAVRVRRIALPDGELVLLEDRSRVEELEREVRRLDRLAGLSELALGIAHEIKNPLNGVMGFASLLQRSDDPATMRRYAARIGEGMRAVDEIVKGLLGFAKPSRNRLAMAPVRAVVERVVDAAGMPRSRCILRGDVDAAVDADAVGRVLANLVRNALEASPAAVVRIDAARSGDELELLVEDDGPGVPADVAPRMFEPFVSTKERGTGLGLPLSARVLSFLGGDLQLLNPGEPGARFRVRVPAAAPAAALAPAEANA